MHNIGNLYSKGEGVPKDNFRAFQWYKQAAEKGLSESQLNLGVMYYTGKGVKQNIAQSFYWYKEAAEKGNSLAQAALGGLYAMGQGVEPDKILAYMWLDLAVTHGNWNAILPLADIKKQLSLQQIEEGQRRVIAWKPRISTNQQRIMLLDPNNKPMFTGR